MAVVKEPIEQDRGYATPCLIWQGCLTKKGYARRFVDGQSRQAHRVAYERAHGPQPGKVVDHLCRQRDCVNVEHLEAISNAENIRRGRSTTLTSELVCAIRASTDGVVAVARRYGIDHSTVANIRAGRRWVAL